MGNFFPQKTVWYQIAYSQLNDGTVTPIFVNGETASEAEIQIKEVTSVWKEPCLFSGIYGPFNNSAEARKHAEEEIKRTKKAFCNPKNRNWIR